jgi:hypothetical protein
LIDYGASVRFEWSRSSREVFEGAVELLLEAKHEKARTTFAPDGRGGDGGIDFWAQTKRKLTIYQLKHYVDGFKSSTRSRKAAVKDSFETALAHRPDLWVLVVPAKLTNAERSFVLGLTAPPGSIQPRIEILDLPKLELLLTKFPEVTRHLDRDPVFEAIEERQIELAEARSAKEIVERAKRLASRGGNIDADWDMGVMASSTGAWVYPIAKHPKSAQKSPLRLELTIDPSKMPLDLQVTFNRSVKFRTGEAVRIPRKAITRQISMGPSWQWGPQVGDFEIQALQNPRPDQSFFIELFDVRGTSLGRHEGFVEHTGHGTSGGTITARFYQGLLLQWQLPFDSSVPGTCNMTINIHRLDVADARDSIRLSRQLAAETFRIELSTDGDLITAGEIHPSSVEQPEDLLIFEQFADDLQVLLNRTGSRRRLPATATPVDRAMARVGRLLLEGKSTLLPPMSTFDGIVDTKEDPNTAEELRRHLTTPGALLLLRSSFKVSIADIPFDFGPVAVHSTAAGIKDGDSLLQRLDTVGIEGEKISYQAHPDVGWLILPHTGSAAPHEPAPWGLIGMEEHHGFGRTIAPEEYRTLDELSRVGGFEAIARRPLGDPATSSTTAKHEKGIEADI